MGTIQIFIYSDLIILNYWFKISMFSGMLCSRQGKPVTYIDFPVSENDRKWLTHIGWLVLSYQQWNFTSLQKNIHRNSPIKRWIPPQIIQLYKILLPFSFRNLVHDVKSVILNWRNGLLYFLWTRHLFIDLHYSLINVHRKTWKLWLGIKLLHSIFIHTW